MMMVLKSNFAPLTDAQSAVIVGMGIHLGGCADLNRFQKMIYRGEQLKSALPLQRRSPDVQSWLASAGVDVEMGGFLQSLDVDLAALNLPPDALDISSVDDVLLVSAAAAALADAGFPSGEFDDLRAAFIVLGAAGPIRAAHLVDLWGLDESQVLIPEHDGRLASALQTGQALLNAGQVDFVLVAASSWLGSPSFRPVPGRVAEGSAAVVLQNGQQALRFNRRVYAVVSGVESQRWQGKSSAEALLQCCQQGLQNVKSQPAQVGVLEWVGTLESAQDNSMFRALSEAYPSLQDEMTCGFGALSENIGFVGSAAGLTSLIKSALCIYGRFVPAASFANLDQALLDNSLFYLPADSRPWFQPDAQPRRMAALTGPDGAEACMQVLLTAAPQEYSQPAATLLQSGLSMILVSAEKAVGLLDEAQRLKTALENGERLSDLAIRAYHRYRQQPQGTPTAVILARTTADGLRELEFAFKGLPNAIANQQEWQTPQGSYFTPQPLGFSGKVAFVYPGAFNSYIGAGKEMFFLFPQLFSQMSMVSADLGESLKEKYLYPRSRKELDKSALDALEARLMGDPLAMLASGTSLAVLYTMLLRDLFQVHAEAAFGYSLGENSMMFASRVWQQGDAVRARLDASPLFRTRLAGVQNAVREKWGLPLLEEQPSTGLWANLLVMATPERVREVLLQEERVYLTHINAPRQVVIAGDPQACERVAAASARASLRAPFDYALHCEPVRSEMAQLSALHDWPVENMPDCTLYTAAGCRPMVIEREALANQFAEMLSGMVDFPALVNRVYEDSARIFVELGAGSNCSKWVEETLKGRPFCAMSINRRGVDDLTSILRVLARLVCHGVALDLSPVFAGLALEPDEGQFGIWRSVGLDMPESAQLGR